MRRPSPMRSLFMSNILRPRRRVSPFERWPKNTLHFKRAIIDQRLINRICAVDSTDFVWSLGTGLFTKLHQIEIRKWLFGLNVAPKTFNNYRDRISFLFGCGITQGYLAYVAFVLAVISLFVCTLPVWLIVLVVVLLLR